MDNSDYYLTLGVTPNSTFDEIKSAFRLLAKRYHPDITKDQNTSKQFCKIYIAYDILSDAKKRSQYDSLLQSVRHPVSSCSCSSEIYNKWENEAEVRASKYAKMHYNDFCRDVLHEAGKIVVSGISYIVAIILYFIVYFALIYAFAFINYTLCMIFTVIGILPIIVCRSDDGTSFDPVKLRKIIFSVFSK